MKSEPLIQQTEHNAQKPYKCSDCEKGFTRTYHLENHQSAHWRKKKNILNAGIVKRALLWQLILHNMIEDTLGNQN